MIRLLVVLAVSLFLRWSSIVESLVFYHPLSETFATPAGTEDVTFTTSDGIKLHGWFLRASDYVEGEQRPTVLHVHGNAGSVAGHRSLTEFLTFHGFNVFIFDYRGYGKSAPASMLTRDELMRDTRAAMEVLLQRGDVDSSRIGVYGISLGGTLGINLAAEHEKVRAVAAISTFASFMSVSHDHVPVLGPMLIPSGFDSIDAVKRLGTRPLLLMHGDADGIVRVHHTRTLDRVAKAAGVDVQTTIIAGGDHNTMIGEYPDNQAVITEFFKRTLK
jgi:uncharacterized protein